MPPSLIPAAAGGPYATLAVQAAEHAQVTKLAGDAGLTAAQVRSLAALVHITPTALVKAAYADPADFAQFLGQATGRIKQAGVLGSLTGLLAKLKAAPGAVGGAINSRMAGTKVDNVLGAALSRVPAVANATPTRRLVTGGTLLGGAEELGRRTVGGGGATPPIGPVPGADAALAGMQAPQPAAAAPAAPKPAMGPPRPKPLVGPPKPAATATAPKPKTAPGGSAQGPAAAGLSPAMRGLLVGGGTLAAGAAGGALLANRSAKKKDKEKSAELHAIGRLIEKQAAVGRRIKQRTAFCRYLDKVAADLPLARQAVLRTIQGELARGRSLSYAVKQAYPHASGEDRGLFMGQLVRLAAKQAESAGGMDSTSVATATPSTYTGPAGGGAEAMKSLTGF